MKHMFFWNSLAFSMIQRMLAIWSLVPLSFLNPAWKSESSWFMYCRSLAWRILNIFYDKEGTNIQWRKDSLFSKWYCKNWTITCTKMKSEYSLTPYTKTNSKLIKDLNVRLGTMKLLEENISRTFSDISHRKTSFNPLLRIMKIKTKVKKWDLSLKAFTQQNQP